MKRYKKYLKLNIDNRTKYLYKKTNISLDYIFFYFLALIFLILSAITNSILTFYISLTGTFLIIIISFFRIHKLKKEFF